MNKLLKVVVFVIFSVIFLSSCAATGARFSIQENVENGKARIIFYRPKDFVGGAVDLAIHENSVEILKIQNGQYISYIVEPNANIYFIKTAGKNNELELNLEPNQTYYVRAAIRNGAFVNTLYLSRVYESEAIEELSMCCKSGGK